ncbi:MAG: lipoprotein insertase outer membrane protein LolB [Gammaproteobacteria bacterium]|nr:lipoprotein insertase outer membrane protein LolB [Gammaproteobacteria bacterium]
MTQLIKTYTLGLVLLLTACTAPSPPGVQTDTPNTKKPTAARIKAAKHLSSWTITGAVAAKSKRKAWTASLDWKQYNLNRYQLRLFGPLGGGSVLVEKNGRLITYQDGGKRVTTTNIDQLFYKETGVRVPLHNLYYWVRGVKAPGAIQSSQYNATGHLITLKQGGYTIQYENYQTVKGIDLPTKLRVAGPGGHLKLVIKHWEIH